MKLTNGARRMDGGCEQRSWKTKTRRGHSMRTRRTDGRKLNCAAPFAPHAVPVLIENYSCTIAQHFEMHSTLKCIALLSRTAKHAVFNRTACFNCTAHFNHSILVQFHFSSASISKRTAIFVFQVSRFTVFQHGTFESHSF